VPPTGKVVVMSEKVPLGGGADTVIVIGVRTEQLSPTGVRVAVPGVSPVYVLPVVETTELLELIRAVGPDWQEPDRYEPLPPTVMLVVVTEKVPLGAAVTVRITGVLIEQLPPTGVIVVVPGAIAFTNMFPLIVATAGLELVRLVGEMLHWKVCVVEAPTGKLVANNAKVPAAGGLLTVTVIGVAN
jgi:hypothetical protein